MLSFFTTRSGLINVRLTVNIAPRSHRLRPHVAEDILVMENPDQPEWYWNAGVSEVDGRWLELTVSRDTARVRRSTTSVGGLLTGG
jgi:hypothetical protein